MAVSTDHHFAALADATRRAVVERLWLEDASISDLAGQFSMSLTGMKKHVQILEDAGLVITQKRGRVRQCRLGAAPLTQEAAWIAQYQAHWAARFNALDGVLEAMKSQTELPQNLQKKDAENDQS